MAVLVKRSRAFIAKRFDERMEVQGSFLAPVQGRMNNFKQKIMSGQVSLHVGMEAMDDAKVSAIIDLLELTPRRPTPRSVSIVCLLWFCKMSQALTKRWHTFRDAD